MKIYSNYMWHWNHRSALRLTGSLASRVIRGFGGERAGSGVPGMKLIFSRLGLGREDQERIRNLSVFSPPYLWQGVHIFDGWILNGLRESEDAMGQAEPVRATGTRPDPERLVGPQYLQSSCFTMAFWDKLGKPTGERVQLPGVRVEMILYELMLKCQKK